MLIEKNFAETAKHIQLIKEAKEGIVNEDRFNEIR